MRIETIFPAYSWMTKMTGKSVSADAYAGFTNAAIVLPQGVACLTSALVGQN